MHINLKSGNREIMMRSMINEIIKNIYRSILPSYQENIAEKMKDSYFIFNYVDRLL